MRFYVLRHVYAPFDAMESRSFGIFVYNMDTAIKTDLLVHTSGSRKPLNLDSWLSIASLYRRSYKKPDTIVESDSRY